MIVTPRLCKDCIKEGTGTKRAANYPGPRCYTHHHAKRERDRLRAHGRRVEANFGITSEDYWKLYAAQGGKCFICQRATGKARRLACDHDHQLARDQCGHPPEQGCRLCLRALLCGPCNELLGRYGVEALKRAIEVLTDPPARKML